MKRMKYSFIQLNLMYAGIYFMVMHFMEMYLSYIKQRWLEKSFPVNPAINRQAVAAPLSRLVCCWLCVLYVPRHYRQYSHVFFLALPGTGKIRRF